MQTPLLAAAMIVKNEERDLPACLEALNALRPLLAEICIYDTGSTDATVEIARSYGARVVEGYWDADFARARNEAIAMCDAKWVLIVDADERVTADVPQLQILLRQMLTAGMTGYDAANARVTVVNPDGTHGVSWNMIRFLRPSRCHYAGAIHEAVVRRDPSRSCRAALLAPAVFTLSHHGYDSAEVMAGKGARNSASADVEMARMAESGAETERVRSGLISRGRSRRLAGDLSGAESDLRAAWDLPGTTGLRTWAGETLAEVLNSAERWDDTAVLVRDLRAVGSQTAFCNYLLGVARSGQGRHQEALDLLRAASGAKMAPGVDLAESDLISAHGRAALDAGVVDEAIACLITLMAVHGVIAGRGRSLMGLWGDRPAELLSVLLLEADHGHTEDICRELARHGDAGREVAARLRIAARRAGHVRS